MSKLYLSVIVVLTSLLANVSAAEDASEKFYASSLRTQVPAIELVTPRYPNLAARKGHEGYAVLSYTIDTHGNATDIQVIDASRKSFAHEAKRSLKQSRFATSYSNTGKPVNVSNQVQRFVFTLKRFEFMVASR